MFNEIPEWVKAKREYTEQPQSLSSKLSNFMSPKVYESIFASKRDVVITTERKKLTVFFSGLKDLKAKKEGLKPDELALILNDYLINMAEITIEHGTTVDKYIGDAIVMFCGNPTTLGVHEDALACIRTAMAIQCRTVDLRSKRKDLGYDRPLRMRNGINTGFLNVRNCGSEKRMDYTIIVGEVNLAARLEGIDEADGIALANKTCALVKNEFDAVAGDPIHVKGIARKITPYFVRGILDDLEMERPFISSVSHAICLFVNLRLLDKKGRIDTATGT